MNAMSIINNAGLSIKKHSPEILLVTGIVSVVAGTIMACKATKKVDPILEEHKELMDRVRQEEDEKDRKKGTFMVYAHTAGSLGKLYGPAALLEIGGLAAIGVSHIKLREENSALAATAAALDLGWKGYRGRVKDRFGEEVENQIYHNLQPEEIEETVTDDKGKEKKVKKTVSVADKNAGGQFTRYFTKGNVNWKPDDDWNKTFISLRQSYFTDILKAKGSLTINEVFREMGFAECKEGMINGWLHDETNPNLANCVKIDMTEVYIPNEFGELERALAIDFNIDGNIYKMMD